jgi:hypothetical protein
MGDASEFVPNAFRVSPITQGDGTLELTAQRGQNRDDPDDDSRSANVVVVTLRR